MIKNKSNRKIPIISFTSPSDLSDGTAPDGNWTMSAKERSIFGSILKQKTNHAVFDDPRHIDAGLESQFKLGTDSQNAQIKES